MIPGIIDSPRVYAAFPPAPGEAYAPVAVENVYSAEINAEDTGTLTIPLGDNFVGRFFIVSFVGTRSVVTGSSLSPTLIVNGTTAPFLSTVETWFGYHYQAILVVDGTSATLRFTNSGAVVRRFTVWKIGTEDNPGQLVRTGGGGADLTTASVEIPLRSSVLTEDTKILTVTGARPQDAGDTFVEAWLVAQTTDQEFHRDASSRIQHALGTVPEGVTSFNLPDSTPTSRRKEGRYFQLRQPRVGEMPIDLGYTNLKYRFDASVGCYRDVEKIIPCFDGDGVAVWENLGTSVDAKQSVKARRPIFKTGGVNGLPYIECLRDNQQHFEDLLDLPQPSGFTGWTPLMIHIVAQFYDFDTMNPIISDGGQTNAYKSDFHIRTDGSLRLYKGTQSTVFAPEDQLCVITARLRNNVDYDFMVNGVFTSVAVGSSSPSNDQTITQFLRSTGSLGPGYFHGRIYELSIFHDTPALGTPDYAAYHRYLAQKYSIALPY